MLYLGGVEYWQFPYPQNGLFLLCQLFEDGLTALLKSFSKGISTFTFHLQCIKVFEIDLENCCDVCSSISMPAAAKKGEH